MGRSSARSAAVAGGGRRTGVGLHLKADDAVLDARLVRRLGVGGVHILAVVHLGARLAAQRPRLGVVVVLLVVADDELHVVEQVGAPRGAARRHGLEAQREACAARSRRAGGRAGMRRGRKTAAAATAAAARARACAGQRGSSPRSRCTRSGAPSSYMRTAAGSPSTTQETVYSEAMRSVKRSSASWSKVLSQSTLQRVSAPSSSW